MVIGNGLLAQSFSNYQDNENIIIFASGVSNSQETDENAFIREKNLLAEALSNASQMIFVYFSTCSIEDPSLSQSAYVKHKVTMEKLVKSKAAQWYVFRLPQVVGPTKSPTLVHYLFDRIALNETLTIQKFATRNLIWHEDIFFIVKQIITENILLNKITNIASPYHLKVEEIVQLIENELQITVIKEYQSKGASYVIDSIMISEITKKLKIFDDDYPKKVISKYAKLYKKGT